MKGSAGNISNNPLYPPKKESDAKGVLVAVASVIVAIICLALIVSHFSYVMHPDRIGGGWGFGNTVQTGSNDIQSDEMQPEVFDESESQYMDSDEADQQFTYDGIPEQYSDDLSQQALPDQQSGEAGQQTMPDEIFGMPEDDFSAGNDDYILPNSNTIYLGRLDIEHLDAEQLRIARNEIFARHGRIFNDEALQQYFESKDWYSGTVSADDFDAEVLNDCERANAALIQTYEEEMGYR